MRVTHGYEEGMKHVNATLPILAKGIGPLLEKEENNTIPEISQNIS